MFAPSPGQAAAAALAFVHILAPLRRISRAMMDESLRPQLSLSTQNLPQIFIMDKESTEISLPRMRRIAGMDSRARSRCKPSLPRKWTVPAAMRRAGLRSGA